MAITHGKWESLITIPSGGATIGIGESGGGSGNVTFAAGETYYWSSPGNNSLSLIAEIQAQLDASPGTLARTYTVSMTSGEDGTGLVSIAPDSGTLIVTFSSTIELLFGVVTNPALLVNPWTSERHVEGLWLPDCPPETEYGLDSDGLPIIAGVASVGENGTYGAMMGAKHTLNEYTYQAVKKSRAIAASESSVNESFESFWLDSVAAEALYWPATPGRVRWYRDADDNDTYKTFNVTNVNSPQMQRMSPGYDGLWTVRIPVVLDV